MPATQHNISCYATIDELAEDRFFRSVPAQSSYLGCQSLCATIDKIGIQDRNQYILYFVFLARRFKKAVQPL